MNAREIKTVSQLVTALTDGGNTLAMRLGSIRSAHVRIVMRDHGMTQPQAEASFSACRDEAESILSPAPKMEPVTVKAPTVKPAKASAFIIVDEVRKVEYRATDWGHVGTWLVKLGFPAIDRKEWMRKAKTLLSTGFGAVGAMMGRLTLKAQ